MSVDAHFRAQQLAADADLAAAGGDTDSARSMRLEAALLEQAAFRSVPAERNITRGILALGAVGMLRDAGEDRRALHVAHGYLADDTLLEVTHEELFDLVVLLRQRERAREMGLEVSSSGYTLRLAGRAVLPGGLAPLEQVLMKLEQVKNLAVRTTEWASGSIFRVRGTAPRSIVDACQPLVAPGRAGSYVVDIYFGSTMQLEMFGGRPIVTPDIVVERFRAILDGVVTAEPEELALIVPEAPYRDAFTRLVHNLVPTGRDYSEVVLTPTRGGPPTVLRPEHRTLIRRRLFPPSPPIDESQNKTGTLRALDLDRGSLALVQEDGTRTLLHFDRGRVLDDVVGPFVNHRVLVRGETRKGGFYVSDIEAADES